MALATLRDDCELEGATHIRKSACGCRLTRQSVDGDGGGGGGGGGEGDC